MGVWIGTEWQAWAVFGVGCDDLEGGIKRIACAVGGGVGGNVCRDDTALGQMRW